MTADVLTREGVTRETVERLRPEIEAARERMAEERRLPHELAHRMAAEGLFHLFAPAGLEGAELSPWAVTSLVEELSAIDGSAGWAAMIGSQSSWFAAFLKPDALERSPRGTPPVLAGALKPGGKATPVDGGYCVSGRWQFASGCTYADYLYGTALVERGEAGGMPEVRLVFVPATEAKVLDTWHTTGLRGTGSNDFVVNELFVPEARTIPYPQLAAPWHSGPLYRDRFYNLIFTAQAGHALGVGRSALASFRELAASKVRWGSSTPLRDSAVVRTTAAEAYSRIEASRAWVERATADAWGSIATGQQPSMQQRVDLRLAITTAITGALSAAEMLVKAAGAAALSDSSALQRQYQDLLAANAHVQATPVILEYAGAHVLEAGQAPPPVLF